jgi:Tol biopolymer transport system component
LDEGSGAETEIYTMNADGTDEKKLTQNRAGDYDPAWQPVQ